MICESKRSDDEAAGTAGVAEVAMIAVGSVESGPGSTLESVRRQRRA